MRDVTFRVHTLQLFDRIQMIEKGDRTKISLLLVEALLAKTENVPHGPMSLYGIRLMSDDLVPGQLCPQASEESSNG